MAGVVGSKGQHFLSMIGYLLCHHLGMCKHPKPFSLSSSSSGNGVKQEFGLLLRLKILHKSLGLTVTCSALRTYDNT